jgi:integrase/recombinase XerD
MERKIEDFLDYVQKVKKGTKNTIDSYRRDLVKMSGYFIRQGIFELEKVNVTNVNSYILYLEKDGKSVSTITRNISCMKTFFKYLNQKGVIEIEPTESIVTPKVKRKNLGVNSVKSIEKLLNQPKGKTPREIRDKAMFELLYATGMRVSELVDVKVDDVNVNMEYVIYNNGKKERVIPFGKAAKNALSRYLKSSRDIMLKNEKNDYLFLNCHGKKLSRQGFWKILKEYAQDAGINEEITPHSLRHSFGAHLVANGADIYAVKEMMGHSDIASTQLYLTVNGNNIKEIYNKTHPRH